MTLRLGVVVVYVVEDGQERLLDLHLSRLARHTAAPYTIHGVTVRTGASCRRRLERDPQAVLHDLPPTALRGAAEHSYYLEPLVHAALDGGATHVVTLHLDSFPVRDGWVEHLIERIQPPHAFATVPGISTACLLFPRSFHVAPAPSFLLPPDVLQSGDGERYLRERAPSRHSGIGYGFKAWQNGLTWYEMPLTAGGRSHGLAEASGAEIHGDLLFHLKGAVRLRSVTPPELPAPLRRLGRARVEAALRLVRAAVPEGARKAVRRRWRPQLEPLIDGSRLRWMAEGLRSAAERLDAAPDDYIEELRRRGVR
jgi:hypothetical protein